MLNIKYSMVLPPFIGGRGDESLMFNSPEGMTRWNFENLKLFYNQFYILNIKYSMVLPPFTGGRGDESLMF